MALPETHRDLIRVSSSSPFLNSQLNYAGNVPRLEYAVFPEDWSTYYSINFSLPWFFSFSENTWNNNTLRWDGSIITLVPYDLRRVEWTTRSINWKPTFQWHHDIMNTNHTAQFYLYLLHNKLKTLNGHLVVAFKNDFNIIKLVVHLLLQTSILTMHL